jgi:hypothetical protein
VSAVIVIGLVVMWAVVLIPMWLRRHDETEESRSVDRFTTAMHTLSRREAKEAKQAVAAERYGLMPHRARNLEVHVSGASAPASRVRVPATAAQRRRRTLAGLLLATVVFLVLAVATGSLFGWAAQIVCDLAVAAFVAHLRRMAVASASARRRRPVVARPAAAARMAEAAPAYEYDEYEFEERVAVRRYASEQAAAYDAPYDDAYSDRYDEPVYAHAGADAPRAAVGGVFDQTEPAEFDDDAYAPVSAAAAVFDQDVDFAPAPVAEERQSFIDAGAQLGRRDELVYEEPVYEESAAFAPAPPVGGSPWEPVPVPRPTYTMKPAAPPRRRRAELDEPLLPPVETAAEAGSPDELEEILDRRWAVND